MKAFDLNNKERDLLWNILDCKLNCGVNEYLREMYENISVHLKADYSKNAVWLSEIEQSYVIDIIKEKLDNIDEVIMCIELNIYDRDYIDTLNSTYLKINIGL